MDVLVVLPTIPSRTVAFNKVIVTGRVYSRVRHSSGSGSGGSGGWVVFVRTCLNLPF